MGVRVENISQGKTTWSGPRSEPCWSIYLTKPLPYNMLTLHDFQPDFPLANKILQLAD